MDINETYYGQVTPFNASVMDYKSIFIIEMDKEWQGNLKYIVCSFEISNFVV